MRRVRDRLTYANVLSTIALFLVLTGGTAVALSGTNTVFSDDIVDNQVFSADVRNDAVAGGGLTATDLRNSSVGTSEVVNGALKDVDIGQSTYRFSGNIGVVNPQGCNYKLVTSIDAQVDHLLLTPNRDDAALDLDYGVEYSTTPSRVWIRICNPTANAINDGNTTFNLLVIDAN